MAADPEGLTLAFGNSWTGDSSITFDGLPADANSALGSVELQAGDHAGEVAHVTVAALVSQPGYVYSPANEHFYEYVPAEGITWDAALEQASQRTLDGQQGYLATIPDAEVNGGGPQHSRCPARPCTLDSCSRGRPPRSATGPCSATTALCSRPRDEARSSRWCGA